MLITASHITKYNNLKCIVDDVSFTINEQDKIALIGVNGTGKSTLLKMISDRENYQGDILKRKIFKSVIFHKILIFKMIILF